MATAESRNVLRTTLQKYHSKGQKRHKQILRKGILGTHNKIKMKSLNYGSLASVSVIVVSFTKNNNRGNIYHDNEQNRRKNTIADKTSIKLQPWTISSS